MVSLNYKNNVLKSALYEGFNAKEFIQKYKTLSDKIASFNSESYGTSAFLKDDGQSAFILTIPFSSPSYVYYKSNAEKQTILNELTSKRANILEDFNGKTGVMAYMSCRKLIIYINDNLDYSFGNSEIYAYFSEKLDIQRFLDKIEETDGQRVKFFDLPDILRNKFQPIIQKYKSQLNKEDKKFNSDIINTNIKDKKENMEDIYIDEKSIIDKGLVTDNPDDYYTKGHHSMKLSPQYLVRSTNYMTINAVASTVKNSLIGIEKQEEKKDIRKWLSASLLYDVVEKTANGNSNEHIEIIDEERLKKAKLKIPNLNKIINPNKKNVFGVETLGGINNDTLGYSIVKNLSVWPIEILSPIVLSNMDPSIKWGRDGDMSSKDILDEIFGIENIKKSLISYPENSEKFFDSFLGIPIRNSHKQMKISTKGGISGLGAPASLSSLSEMLVIDGDGSKSNNKINTERIITDLNGYNFRNQSKAEDFIRNLQIPLSIYGKALLKTYPAETIYLILFGICKPSLHQKIVNYLCKYGFFGIDLRQINGSINSFINRTNSSLNLTDAVMKLLNYQKYEVSQVNATPRMENGKFWYEYNIQYPAHFHGTVKMESRGNKTKSIVFHIMPSK